MAAIRPVDSGIRLPKSDDFLDNENLAPLDVVRTQLHQRAAYAKAIQIIPRKFLEEIPHRHPGDDAGRDKFKLYRVDLLFAQQAARSAKDIDVETFRIDLEKGDVIDAILLAETVERLHFDVVGNRRAVKKLHRIEAETGLCRAVVIGKIIQLHGAGAVGKRHVELLDPPVLGVLLQKRKGSRMGLERQDAQIRAQFSKEPRI